MFVSKVMLDQLAYEMEKNNREMVVMLKTLPFYYAISADSGQKPGYRCAMVKNI